MSTPPKRRALGRGLSALLPGAGSVATEAPAPAGDAAVAERRRDYFQAAIEDIYPNPDQPRKRFAEAELEELAQSIRVHGIIQPLIVRARPEGGYFLIAGERRWRASQRAGQHRVPVVVQDVTAADAFERALVENLQRSDLNAIEEAEAYRRLADEYGHTQEQIAERVGKDRSTVTNSLRLLKLPLKVRRMVEDGDLSMGHARALLALDTDAAIETTARAVIDKKLSVRATEGLVKTRDRKSDKRAGPAQKSPSVRDLEQRLTTALGAQTRIRESGKSGTVEIQYTDLDHLDRLLERLLP